MCVTIWHRLVFIQFLNVLWRLISLFCIKHGLQQKIKVECLVSVNPSHTQTEILNKKWKAFNVTAKWVFFCLNSIHNHFVNPELIIAIYSEKWGSLPALYCPPPKKKVFKKVQQLVYYYKWSHINILAKCSHQCAHLCTVDLPKNNFLSW